MILLKIMEGADEGRSFKMTRKSFTLGRSPKSDVVISDSYASRQHGEIIFSKGRYVYRDLNSTSGSTIKRGDKEMCLDHVWSECQLEDDDRLIIGKTIIQVSIAPEELPSETEAHTQISHASRPAKTLSEIEADFQRDRKALYQIIKLGRKLSLEKTTSLEDIFEYASELIYETFPRATHITLVLKDPKGGEYLPAYLREKAAPRHQRVRAFPARPVVDQVIEDQVSITFRDMKKESQYYPGMTPPNIRSSVFVPLWNGKEILGVLQVDNRQKTGVFTKEHMDILTTFAFEIALLIDNQRLYEESYRNARLAGIGQSAAGLSHDIANLMTGWKAGGDLIEMGLGKKKLGLVSEGWSISQNKHQAIFDLVEDLRYCSKPRPPELELGDINQLLGEAVKLETEKARGKDIEFELRLDSKIPEFLFDRKRLQRVFINLLSNAIDAIDRKQGVIRVSSQAQTGGKTVVIGIEDNGSGIPPDSLDKIFDLLYSTKKSRGTGLGLAIAKKVVDEHGGKILVESRVGKGTKFTISLPLKKKRRSES